VRGLDEAVFRWINGWPDSWSPFFVFLSQGNKLLWVRIVFGLLIVAMLAAGRKTRTAVLLAIVAALVSNELTDVLKATLAVPRPSVDFPEAIVRVKRLTSFGTASAHAANMAALAGVMFAFFRWRAAPLLLLALLVGLSRVYVGVHYPSQVLFGWLCGLFVSWMAVWTYRAWLRTRVSEPAPEDDHAEPDEP
jgi:undecaprenyl-diphosphatase